MPVGERDRKDDGARVGERWCNEAAQGRCPSMNETARMTVPALLGADETRAARGRDESDIPL